MDFDDFISRIKKVKTAESERGVIYSIDIVTDKDISGLRQSTKKPYHINTKDLYKGYVELKDKGVNITTTALKQYVDRVQSPSLAILKAADLI